ncbi:hypothetical protein GCM10008179_25900 [Hansschlegelia plantiphila]|uniref:Uncharacterized protein n=2 Tax=Hansschlegelia plantiphila TaxID=374655 RepID=A0A9W6MWL5_9HYPH|nr:hypothetical protein GCM10008179_25900 [Hansschlegelia plantiphila]
MNSIRNLFRRAFSCWPSRIAALALLALTVSWGSEGVWGLSSRGGAETVAAVE